MSDLPAPDLGNTRFGNTRWSLVEALREGTDGHADIEVARQRLIELCLHYWYPVYVYLRRSGHAPEMAQRMTAGFFTRLLHDAPARAPSAPTGRFRVFLMTELHRYLSQYSDEGDAPPGLEPPVSLDELEARQRIEPTGSQSPEQSLRRGFALEIIARARVRLRDEARETGRLAMYEALERYLGTEPRPGEYEALAHRLGARPVFIALAVKRLRQRFRELVELELSQIVSNAADLENERNDLLAAIAGVFR